MKGIQGNHLKSQRCASEKEGEEAWRLVSCSYDGNFKFPLGTGQSVRLTGIMYIVCH